MNPSLPPIPAIPGESERIDRLRTRLVQQYHVRPADVRVVRAPLRICPLGAHIDHQLGVVTGMTIDQALLFAFAPTRDGTVCVESVNFSHPISFGLRNVPPYRRGDWGNYIRGAVLALQHEHELTRGLVGVVDGQMPVGGLSSSAAVTIAYLLALESVNEIAATPLDNISLVTRTEHDYIGLNNGILDQTSILFSEPGQLTRIDCRDRAIDRIGRPATAEAFDIMIVYSGVRKGLVGTGYNNRVAECQEAARLLLERSGQSVENPRLRHVDPARFAAEGQHLPDLPRRRATHYFGEMQRVADGVEAWKEGDIRRFGTLMNESGESSIRHYECGCPQLITLYEILRDTPGVHGVRFSGAGFRGNCIAFTEPGARDRVAAAVHQHYPPAHPDMADLYSIHFCQPAGPATLI